MAGSVNKVIIMGRVGRDPEIRSTQSGARLANFSVATSESWRDKHTGERKEKTEWHNISVWPENTVNVVEKYVKKGDLILVEGQLQTRKWTDQSGGERYSTEIVIKAFAGSITLIGQTQNSGGGRARADDQGDAYDGGRQAPSSGRGSDLDDEIPF